MPSNRIGKNAMILALEEQDELNPALVAQLESLGYRYCVGKVGSMEPHKVVAAIETSAKKNKVIRSDLYRDTHALYHTIMEALYGVTRSQIQLGSVLRTVGLNFAVVRGNPYPNQEEGDWVAVALYGTIGAPIKGLEHEAIGLGVNHM